MARKPNYTFERNARAKAKADKREAKRQAKLAAKADKRVPDPADPEANDAPEANDDPEAGETHDGESRPLLD